MKHLKWWLQIIMIIMKLIIIIECQSSVTNHDPLLFRNANQKVRNCRHQSLANYAYGRLYFLIDLGKHGILVYFHRSDRSCNYECWETINRNFIPQIMNPRSICYEIGRILCSGFLKQPSSFKMIVIILDSIYYLPTKSTESKRLAFHHQHLPELKRLAEINAEFSKINFADLLQNIFRSELTNIRSISIFWSQKSTTTSKYPSFFVLYNHPYYDYVSHTSAVMHENHGKIFFFFILVFVLIIIHIFLMIQNLVILELEIDKKDRLGHMDAIYRPDIWYLQADRLVMQLYLFRSGYYMPTMFCLHCPIISWELLFPIIPIQSLFDCPINPCIWPLIDSIYYDPRNRKYYLFQGRWMFIYTHTDSTSGNSFDITNTEKVLHFWNLNFHVRFSTSLLQTDKELLLIGYNRTIINSLQTAVMNIGDKKVVNPNNDRHRIFDSINFDKELRDANKFDIITGMFAIDKEKDQNYLWLVINHNDFIKVRCKKLFFLFQTSKTQLIFFFIHFFQFLQQKKSFKSMLLFQISMVIQVHFN